MNKVIHFELAADDTNRISAFYHDVFDWEIMSPPTPEIGEPYLLAVAGPATEPGISGAIKQHHPHEQRVVTTIEVEAIDQAISRVQACGGSIVQGPDVIPGVGRQCYCSDPEGTLFGLLEPARAEAPLY
jgi:predicted enzyme related to lactoylglutathione lyase